MLLRAASLFPLTLWFLCEFALMCRAVQRPTSHERRKSRGSGRRKGREEDHGVRAHSVSHSRHSRLHDVHEGGHSRRGAPSRRHHGHSHGHSHRHGEPVTFRTTLTNSKDIQYTLDLVIGGQTIQSIPDSGSFDLLVFSTHCELCGDAALMYNDANSQSYSNTSFIAVQHFGSGSTNSVEANDDMQIGHLQADNQVFWEVVYAGFGFADSSFQSIVGIGPPASVVKVAEKEAQTAKESHFDSEVVAHYEAVAKRVKKQTPFLKRTMTRSFSICLRPESGSSGTLIWNDASVTSQPELFTTVPILGDLYWSAELRNIQLGSVSALGKETSLGCGDSRCSAVIDSGTSLLVVPYDAYNLINDVVDKLGASCNDINTFPELQFELGGKPFTLGPESYMGKLNGELSEELRAMMPRAKKVGNRPCMPLLMTCDEVLDDYGPMWILGLPFFKKYYTNFQLNRNCEKPESMSFSLADESCYPTKADGLARVVSHHNKSATGLSVEASMIRPPAWLKQSRVKRAMLARAQLASITRK